MAKRGPNKGLYGVYVESRNAAMDLCWKFVAGPFSRQKADDAAAAERARRVVSTISVRPYDGREEIPIR